MSPFILATAILDLGFLADVEQASRDSATGIGAIKNFDRENMRIAVGILLLGYVIVLHRSRDMPLP